jgi:hypothetical protein
MGVGAAIVDGAVGGVIGAITSPATGAFAAIALPITAVLDASAESDVLAALDVLALAAGEVSDGAKRHAQTELASRVIG